jgi:crotonobetainyl-CoA:carnitine CoA-transferase CaiB-like acyl-CoA transferase
MTAPLQGCRVLDLGIITAGAATAALLADLGAEVIKVESPTYRDPFRGWAGGPVLEPGGMPPLFRATNRNKTAVSLDLKHQDGRAAFLRLVARSDVVVENFRRGVMARLGLDYAALRAANPDIILASVSSQGETGPDATYVSFGSTLEAVGGMAFLTGYADDAPAISGRDVNYPDQVAAIFSAGMIATAWHARRNGGHGCHLDLSQRELTSFLCGEAFVADAEAPRNGNAQPPHLLQDCFRAQDGAWVAVTVDEADASALQTLIGAHDAGLHDALARWIAARAARAAVDALAQAGVAAAPALDGAGLLDHRGSLWGGALIRTEDGAFVKGFPFQLDATPLAVHRDAPRVGADTEEVLTRVGGYSADEVAALARAGAIECGESDLGVRDIGVSQP